MSAGDQGRGGGVERDIEQVVLLTLLFSGDDLIFFFF